MRVLTLFFTALLSSTPVFAGGLICKFEVGCDKELACGSEIWPVSFVERGSNWVLVDQGVDYPFQTLLREANFLHLVRTLGPGETDMVVFHNNGSAIYTAYRNAGNIESASYAGQCEWVG